MQYLFFLDLSDFGKQFIRISRPVSGIFELSSNPSQTGLEIPPNTVDIHQTYILLLESPCSLVRSFVRNEKTPHHRYTHQGHRSQIYASFIPASYTHASGSRIIYIKLLWIHASCIHASYIHASGSRIKNIYTSYVHTYLRVMHTCISVEDNR